MRVSTLSTIAKLIIAVGALVAVFAFASYDRGGLFAAFMFGTAVFIPGLFMGSLLMGIAAILSQLEGIAAGDD